MKYCSFDYGQNEKWDTEKCGLVNSLLLNYGIQLV